ncbi:MAG: ferrous iron transporter B [Zoogloea sp.]|nr:ferrous iron transporter B [Zoogloea sp.]
MRGPLRRGGLAPRVLLVGRPRTGKSTIFETAASTEVQSSSLPGNPSGWHECLVEVGLEQMRLVDCPSIVSLHSADAGRRVLDSLLWSPAEAPAEVLLQVVDATSLERDLELAQELVLLGRPMVLALNRLDEARARGVYINVQALSEALGVPVMPTVAHMGKGIGALFKAVQEAARLRSCPLPQPPSPHILESLKPLSALLARPAVEARMRQPHPLLLMRVASGDAETREILAGRLPELLPQIDAAVAAASARLPRPVADELHADRHHRAALMYEAVTQFGRGGDKARWRRALDELFLHPRWGLVGSLGVFALVLFMVFEVSAFLDSISSAPLAAWLAEWQPHSTTGVVAHAVADGLVGLVGIVVPYMLPLVMLLVALEQSGIMHRVAFVVDRGFHRIGLHGGVAVPFLLGLGCNVPAISAAAIASSGRERIVASLLITFVPCSARSAILLAIGGKYLGAAGVLAMFLLTMLVIALAGRMLTRRYGQAGPGMIQEIPAYALPAWRPLLATTWERTSDILTIVTPLLVIGSVVLALLTHWQADTLINTALTPVTLWWLGLPVALGVPILFGVLRKELSMLMVFQALGTPEVDSVLSPVQIAVFLIFLSFYVPCLSTFAVMLRTLGRRHALASVGLSVGAALLIAGIARIFLESVRWLAA